ncbi:hypothetical protein, partial [Streptomyces werraensis]|uniref:hypothetical protein n=1 Tax=Streptomyces werraensis TaxID=68284 RepID=UPI003D9DEB65
MPTGPERPDEGTAGVEGTELTGAGIGVTPVAVTPVAVTPVASAGAAMLAVRRRLLRLRLRLRLR